MDRNGVVTARMPGITLPGTPTLGQFQAGLPRIGIIMGQVNAARLELEAGNKYTAWRKVTGQIRNHAPLSPRVQKNHHIAGHNNRLKAP